MANEPAAQRRQDLRLHVGDGRSRIDADSCRLRRDRRANRVADARRYRAHAPAVSRQPTRPRQLGAIRQLQRRQVRNLARPRQSRRARGRARPGAMGRRRHRVLLSQGDARVGLRLRIVAQGQPAPHHAELVPDGTDRAAGENRGLRQYGGGDFRLSQSHRMARPRSLRRLRRVHRLRRAALYRDRDSCRARPSPPHRRGPVHRSVAG